MKVVPGIPALGANDERSCLMLEERAAKLEGLISLLEGGTCRDLAAGALGEAAAILRDAAAAGRRSPNVPGIRES